MKLDLNKRVPKPGDKDFPKINLAPKGDRVIVLPFPAEEVSSGGIIIPDTAKEKQRKGLVVATGPGTEDYPMGTKRGEVVTYGKYTGSEYEFEGEGFLMMRMTDVAGEVVEPY